MREGWRIVSLKEVAEINPKETALRDEDPFVPMDAVDAGKRWVQYTEPKGTRSGIRAKSDDVLFARITPCLENGKTAQVQTEIKRCGGSTEFIVLRPSEQLEPGFLYFCAIEQTIRAQAKALMTGTTGRQRLSANDLAEIQIAIPPPHEQKRIVDLVESIDDYIAALEQQLQAGQTARHSLLSELLRPPDMSEEWRQVAIGDVAEVVSGGTPATKNPDYWGDDIVWVTTTEVAANNGRQIFDSKRKITAEGLANSSAKLLPIGSVVVTTGATIGAVALAGVPLATKQGCTSLICGEDLLPRFAMYWFQKNTNLLLERAAGTTFLDISRKKFIGIPMKLPSIEEQRRIVNLIESLDTYIVTQDSTTDAARTARQALLTDLLTPPRRRDADGAR